MRNAAQSSQPTRTTSAQQRRTPIAQKWDASGNIGHLRTRETGDANTEEVIGPQQRATSGCMTATTVTIITRTVNGELEEAQTRPRAAPALWVALEGCRGPNTHEEINKSMKGTMILSTVRERPKLNYGCQTFASPATIMGNRTSTCTRLAIATNSSQNCTRSATAIPA